MAFKYCRVGSSDALFVRSLQTFQYFMMYVLNNELVKNKVLTESAGKVTDVKRGMEF